MLSYISSVFCKYLRLVINLYPINGIIKQPKRPPQTTPNTGAPGRASSGTTIDEAPYGPYSQGDVTPNLCSNHKNKP